MRYGIIADIHGNLQALEVALARLERAGVDGYLCAGDLVGYGAQPNECVGRVRELEAVTVAGNHDLIALERLPDDQCIPLARESLAWTRATLSQETRRYLAGLPATEDPGSGVRMAHGSWEDPRCYVTRAEHADRELALIRELDPACRVLVLGHTHRSWLYGGGAGTTEIRFGEPLALPTLPTLPTLPAAGPVLLNPGSVGQSRDREPRARFALLDTAAAGFTLFP